MAIGRDTGESWVYLPRLVLLLASLLVTIADPLSAAIAGTCPTVSQFLTIWRCMDGAAGDVGQGERCSRPWGSGQVWRCMKSDPALGSLTMDDLQRALQPAAEVCP